MSTNYVSRLSRIVLAAISCSPLIIGLLNVVPAQAQTPTTVYDFTGTPGPVNPNIEAITQGRDGELYLTAAGGDGKAVNVLRSATTRFTAQPPTHGRRPRTSRRRS